ncbi:MAG: hypothetical protein M0Q90_16545 [Bacteroidales bacterium]|nr:hypothetical protein [Bacteroidales bacterium]
MPGFFGIHGKNKTNRSLSVEQRKNIVIGQINTETLFIERRTVDKFLDDKIFYDDADYTVVTEGVLLNSLDLVAKYRQADLKETIVSMYETNGETFFNEFRGSFSGIFRDKKRDITLIFTDHIGSKQVFYSKVNEQFVFGSEINFIVDFYRNNDQAYHLNKNAAYFLLTYGFMVEEHTLFQEIKKLVAGHYIKMAGQNTEIIRYHLLDNTPNYNRSEEETIEGIDRLFRQAIKRAFEKDREYGYKHLAGLSGGLDSRMTTWVANDMGYGDQIVNYTFSQTDYLDETIPKAIAADLKHEWIFKALDNGLFLKDIDDTVRINSGGALYYGLAHGKSCLDLMDKSKFGIVHTGMLGDVIIGTFYSSLDKDKEFEVTDGTYSKVLAKKLDKSMFSSNYKNEEIFKFYARGFTGANQGLLVPQEFGESYSPFYDLEFLEYCLTIPVELRFNHKIYKQWIIHKYPKAANYVWEKTGGKITDKSVNILGRNILLSKLPKKIMDFGLKKVGLTRSSSNTKKHMNPLDYWYNTNDDLREYLNNYFEENSALLDFDSDLKTDCADMFANYTNIEKNQVLTLLGVMKKYFVHTKYGS